MNASRDALLAARQIEAQLLFAQPDEPSADPTLQLLGFCLRQLGQRQLRRHRCRHGRRSSRSHSQ